MEESWFVHIDLADSHVVLEEQTHVCFPAVLQDMLEVGGLPDVGDRSWLRLFRASLLLATEVTNLGSISLSEQSSKLSVIPSSSFQEMSTSAKEALATGT